MYGWGENAYKISPKSEENKKNTQCLDGDEKDLEGRKRHEEVDWLQLRHYQLLNKRPPCLLRAHLIICVVYAYC